MSPSLLLSVLIAALIGLAAHAASGRYLWQLPLYLGAAAAGVFAGEVLAAATGTGSGLLRYGSVPVGSAFLGGIVGVVLVWAITTRLIARFGPHASE